MPVGILVIPTDAFAKGFGKIKMNNADLLPVFSGEFGSLINPLCRTQELQIFIYPSGKF
jgi:hypothetical protein